MNESQLYTADEFFGLLEWLKNNVDMSLEGQDSRPIYVITAALGFGMDVDLELASRYEREGE